jgi:hypothetical protein
MTAFARLPEGLSSRTVPIDELLSGAWDRKLAADLAFEIGAVTGERIRTVAEVRRFLALKGYRDLLSVLREAREGKSEEEALGAVARSMRAYAVARPALSAAAFRTTAADCPEWRAAHEELHGFMIGIFAECGLEGDAAEDGLNVLRSLVRGFVLNETMHTLIGVEDHDALFESAIRMFVAGLPALAAEPGADIGRAPVAT